MSAAVQAARAADPGQAPRRPVRRADPLYKRIVELESSGVPGKLEEALRMAPDSPVLTDVHEELDGTLLYHAIDRAVLMANSGPNFVVPMENFIACARLLQARGAPARHRYLEEGVVMSYLDSDWSQSEGAGELAQLMRESVAAKVVDFSRRLTGAHARIGGLMPLSAAFKTGNCAAVQVLLELGASLEDPLKDFGAEDIVECARSFGQPNSEVIAAMVTAHLMRQRLARRAAAPQTTCAARRRPAV